MSTSAPDRLTYNGEERGLFSTPLEPYLRDLPARPDFRLGDDVSRNGYVAHWEVRADDTLWLNRLRTRPADQGPDPGLRLVFPDAAGPVPAAWVSQRLLSPTANEVRFNPFGSGTAYARELHLWVTRGRLVLVEEYGSGNQHRTGGRLTPHLEALFGSEEAAFLRAIHAAPADSAPRLVYADWLDERNDVRGPVIRLAERLRTMPPDDQRREMADQSDVLARGLRPDLWSRVLGYDDLAALTHPIPPGTRL